MIRIVPDLFEQTVKTYPKKEMYIDPNRTVCFSEAYEEVSHIASGLIAQGLRKDPILLYIDKSVNCLLALQSVVMSGNFYTVLDTATPMQRIEKIMQTLNPQAILTVADSVEEASSFAGDCPILVYEELSKTAIDEEALRIVRRKIQPTDLLFVLFTSGSTGMPKGVTATHGALMHYISCWEEVFEFSNEDILLSQVPFYFVMSVLDVFAPVAFGATLHMVPQMFFSFPAALLSYVEKHRVTSLVWVTSVLNLIANMDAFSAADLSSVKKVLFGGEVMPIHVLRAWREHVPQAFYVNGYGSTELLDGGLFYRVNRDFSENETLPIGHPFPNMDIFLLGEENQLITKPGEIGEICARGGSVSIGYYNDPERTAEAFVQNPLQDKYIEKIYRTGDLAAYNEFGELAYVGRKDFQIKHMGHRVELGEIEAAARVSGIDEIACVFDKEKERIVAYYTGSLPEKDVRKMFSAKLPDYMQPWKEIRLQEMPHNAHDKIDRAYLLSLAKEIHGRKRQDKNNVI